MTGHATEQKCVVVILPAQKLFVLIQLMRQADFMASRAEFGRLVQWLEEGFFVEFGLGLHQLIIEVL